MATMTRTFTRTHLTITPASPFLACAECDKRVEDFHDDRCGCGIDRHMNMPCCHFADYIDLCPSWGPVDGCTCQRALGHVPHPPRLQFA